MSRLDGKSLLIVIPGADAHRKGALGLGDLVRIVMILPALQARRIVWASNPELFALAHLSGAVDTTVEIDRQIADMQEYDCVLNLGLEPLENGHPNIVNIASLLDDGSSLKEQTYDLSTIFCNFFHIAPDGPVFQPFPTGKPTHDVGFNTRVPPDWQLKEMPLSKWREVEQSLPDELSVAWQPAEDRGLAGYINWVASNRVLVSVVGLGCHVAMLFGRPLVVLSGPTDFREASEYRNGKVLRPSSPCTFRPCYSPSGKDACGGCMQDMDPATIKNAILELLEAEY